MFDETRFYCRPRTPAATDLLRASEGESRIAQQSRGFGDPIDHQAINTEIPVDLFLLRHFRAASCLKLGLDPPLCSLEAAVLCRYTDAVGIHFARV